MRHREGNDVNRDIAYSPLNFFVADNSRVTRVKKGPTGAKPRTSSRFILLHATVLSQLLPHVLAAQTPGVRFSHLTREKGLSQSSVNAIVQDRQGFMWFGTQDGLNRFDGIEFAVSSHSPADSFSITDNYIWCLLEDQEGSLWAGTQSGGVNRLRGDGKALSRYLHDPADSATLASNSVTALCETSPGVLWVGTWGGGLDRLNRATGRFDHFRETRDPERGIPNNFVRCLLEDRSGVLWIGTWGGGLAALTINENRFRWFRHDANDPRSISGNRISSLLEDHTGVLWIGTFDQGLNEFDPASGGFTRFRADEGDPASLSSNSVVSLCEDRSGCLWIATRDAGVNRRDSRTGTFRAYRKNPVDPDAPGSDRVASLYRDRTGGVWVGTNDAGVDNYDPDRPMFMHSVGSASSIMNLHSGVVRSILEDSRGDLWVGTVSAGLDRYVRSRGRYVNYRHDPGDPKSLCSNAVMAVYEDHHGRVWIGTDGDGLDRWDRASGSFVHYWTRRAGERRISGNSVMSIREDSHGGLLVGTTGSGLYAFEEAADRFVPFEKSRALGYEIADNVWAIHEDRKDELWLGTWGEGLCRFDSRSGTVNRYRNTPGDSTSLGNNTVWSICEDRSGTLWFGTWGGGLNRLAPDGEHFIRYTEREGLPNNVVYGILPDDRGNLWVSTNKGLARFNPVDGSFKRFDQRDGLQSDEFNQGAYFKGSDGTLYFGGINGVNLFQPDSIRSNDNVPPVVLTRFRVFDREVPFTEPLNAVREILLEPDENYVSFEFAALNYTEPEKNQYAYTLEGIDNGWISCGARRYAGYTRLDGGTYTFRVKGSNNDGVWNTGGASIRIVIALPFWRRWWFLAGALFVAGLVVYGAFMYRVTKVVEMERLRTTIASDLHDELASNLSSIAMFSNIVHGAAGTSRGIDAEHEQLLGRITILSQESVASIRDIIWAIDPKSESVYDLLIRLKDYLLPLCRAAEIQLSFPDPARISLPGKNLKPGERKDLWLLLKEAVTNAIKHAKCNALAVAYAYTGGTLTMTIRDNGTGFNTSCESAGRGLKTMKMRAGKLGGTLAIESFPGGGTSLRLSMKP